MYTSSKKYGLSSRFLKFIKQLYCLLTNFDSFQLNIFYQYARPFDHIMYAKCDSKTKNILTTIAW